MAQEEWTQNSKLKGIDPVKMEMLLSLTQQSQGKSAKELLPFMMAAASKNKENGMKFSEDEMDLIIEVLKTGKSKEEADKITRLLSMMKMLR